MKQIMKKIVRAVFHQKVSPIVALKPEFAAIIGMPATISPDGQIYAQKPCASPKAGISRTKKNKLNHLISLNFCDSFTSIFFHGEIEYKIS